MYLYLSMYFYIYIYIERERERERERENKLMVIQPWHMNFIKIFELESNLMSNKSIKFEPEPCDIQN